MGGKGTHDERSYFPADLLAISYNGRTLERAAKFELNRDCALQKAWEVRFQASCCTCWIPARDQYLQIQKTQLLEQQMRAGGESQVVFLNESQGCNANSCPVSFQFCQEDLYLKPLPLKSLDQNRSRKLAEKITCLQWSETWPYASVLENRTGLCWGCASTAGAGGRARSPAGPAPVLLARGLCSGTGQPGLRGKAKAQKGVLAHARVCYQTQSARYPRPDSF